MHNLAMYILTAMIAWVPIGSHAYYEKPETTQRRYEDIATDIADAALNEEPLFEQDNKHSKTALLLAAVASTESFYRADIDSCKKSGDHGLAWGDWQTHAPKKSVCSSRKNAAIIALRMMRHSFEVCEKYSLTDKLSIYTDGQCHKNWSRSSFRMNRAISWYKHHPYTDNNESIN